jgi:lipopolysaccharide/colanic/teichoic acid biosynthesis glycosyltransferase
MTDVIQEITAPEVSSASKDRLNACAMRALDVVVAVALLLLLSPVIVAIALLIKLDSRGPVIYRCTRVGRDGTTLMMLKFRKMWNDASGPALTLAGDVRFTRVGRFLALSKLDELPQLWNVVRGEMSLVGPRPETSEFTDLLGAKREVVLSVRPGITGLSQLAFARESEILDGDDTVGDYVRRILPQKAHLDALYVANASLRMNLRVLLWTAVTTVFRRPVAVDRANGALGVRRRPLVDVEEAPSMALRGAGQ